MFIRMINNFQKFYCQKEFKICIIFTIFLNLIGQLIVPKNRNIYNSSEFK